MSWDGSYVNVSLDRQAIKDAPVYDEDAPFDADNELKIYSHYGRKPYWHNNRERAVA